MKIVDGLKWRYAVKKFDPTKKLTTEQINYVKEAINFIPSSYGLQPYKVLEITDPQIRAKLKEAAYGQTQLTDAAHVFVFASFTDYNPAKVEEFVNLTAQINPMPKENSDGFKNYLNSMIAGMSNEQLAIWTAKQVYIALGSMIAAASEIEIDSAAMEGFDKAKFDEILGLKEKGLASAVIGAIGYRSPEDQNQFLKKVRKPMDQLFETI
ncbi:MAG: NAD(P)H-dependent oxidoreductase [Bacteroidia bacterium]|jgi:nitroreductase|nr:NAD(P)H-dependent oxidoreductase [Rikenellaceae bacterium]NCB19325.1 NAD(P)H-dependent oxidoreductase [Bacteroidia bacterium]